MRPEGTVFIVDDDSAVRDSLRWVIESAGMRVQTYETARDFLASFDPTEFGCLVLDVRMPGMSGIDLQRELATRGAQLPIIFITAHATVPTAVHAMRAGAVDFITKPFSDEQLLTRIRECIEQSRRDWEIAREVYDIEGRFVKLTPRERQVLDDIATGKSNKLIAVDRGISQKTVEAHRAKIMHKVGARSLAELMRMVMLLRRDETKGKP